MSQEHQQKTSSPEGRDGRGDPRPELRKLMELATRYPEIGPPVAELAFKLGQAEIGERVVRLGMENQGQAPGVEYYFVTAHAARREGRWQDAMKAAIEAGRAFVEAPEDAVGAEDGSRLLHLIRLGFATMMFELDDIHQAPDFVRGLGEILPKLDDRLGKDPFYRTLLAQTLWFEDRERSEAEWDRAAELGDAELTWNARGTWYKEAERDRDKAEGAYRKGLEAEPDSALLLHNLAQIMVDRAEASKDDDPGRAVKLLREADEHLKAALRSDAPKVRRHIHATRDRLHGLRRSLPGPKKKQHHAHGGKGDRPHGGKGGDRKRGGGKPPPRDRRGGGGGKGKPKEKFLTDGKVGLGEMILAKLKEQEDKG